MSAGGRYFRFPRPTIIADEIWSEIRISCVLMCGAHYR